MPNDAEEDDDFVCKDCDKLSTFPTGCKIPVPTCRGGATPDIDICILIYWCIDLLIYIDFYEYKYCWNIVKWKNRPLITAKRVSTVPTTL